MAETKTKEAVQHVLDTSFSFVLLFGNSQYAIFGGLKKFVRQPHFRFSKLRGQLSPIFRTAPPSVRRLRAPQPEIRRPHALPRHRRSTPEVFVSGKRNRFRSHSAAGRREADPDGCTIIRCAQPSGPRFRYDRPGPRVRFGRAGAVGLTRLIARRPAPAVEAGMFRVVGTIHRPAVGPPSVRHSLPSCCTNSVRVGKANSRPASPKDSRIAMFISDIAFRISPCFSM